MMTIKENTSNTKWCRYGPQSAKVVAAGAGAGFFQCFDCRYKQYQGDKCFACDGTYLLYVLPQIKRTRKNNKILPSQNFIKEVKSEILKPFSEMLCTEMKEIGRATIDKLCSFEPKNLVNVLLCQSSPPDNNLSDMSEDIIDNEIWNITQDMLDEIEELHSEKDEGLIFKPSPTIKQKGKNKKYKNKYEVQSGLSEANLRILLDKVVYSRIRNTKFEDLVDLFENITVLCQGLTYAQGASPEFVTNFLISITKNFTKQSMTKLIASSALFKRIIGDITCEFDREVFSVQSGENIAQTARDFFEKFVSMKHSKFFKKVYKLCLYFMTTSLAERFGFGFQDVGYTKFEAEVMKKKFYLGADFFEILCDTVIFIFERGVQILNTGRVDVLFHSAQEYTRFLDDASEIKRMSQLLANPEAHGFSESTFRSRLDDLIEKGETIKKFNTSFETHEKRSLNILVNELHSIRCDLTTLRASREHRKPPFSVLIYGGSGIGKSTIKDMLFYTYANYFDLDNDRSFSFTRNPTAKYWDGFRTSCWCVFMDDVAFMKPTIASSGGDPSVMEFLQVINAVPFVPDQAALDDKGRTPLRAKLVVGTTNTEHLNAFHYFSCPSAAQRRFPYIVEPVVKDEYTDENGMLDSSKVAQEDVPNYWNWKVYLLKPNKNLSGLGVKTEILSTDDVHVFLKWYCTTAQDFEDKQEIVEKSVDRLANIKVCKICRGIDTNCTCEIQSGVTNWVQNFCLAFNLLELCLFYIIATRPLQFLHMFLIRRSRFYTDYAQYAFYKWYCFNQRYQRWLYSRMGNRIQNSFFKNIRPTEIVALLTSLLLTYRMYRWYKPKKQYETQTVSTEIGVAPQAMENERENVWYKNDFELYEDDLTPNITSSKALSTESLADKVAFNILSFDLETRPGKGVFGKAFCLKGQWYCTNNHNLPPFEGTRKLNMFFQSGKDGVTTNFSQFITERDIVRVQDHDLAFIRLHTLPPKKGLINFIPKSKVQVKQNGFYCMKSHDGTYKLNPIKCVQNTFKIENCGIKFFKGSFYKGSVQTQTVTGDCGTPLILDTPKGFILAGIHALYEYNSNSVFSIVIDQTLLPTLDERYTIQGSSLSVSAPSAERSVGSLHEKSVFRYLTQGSAAVIGSFSGFKRSNKSSVEITPMAHFMSTKGYKIKHGAPVMKGWEPWHIAAKEMVEPVTTFDSDLVERCSQAYLKDVMDNLSEKDLKQVEVYDDFTAVNGAPGVAYIDKINRNTSSGNPWKKSKKKFMTAIPEERGMQHPVAVHDEIMDRVVDIINKYKKGERANPNFCAHLKDEPTSFKKIKMKKTRVFTGAPFDWTIVVRKYLLSMTRLIQNNKFAFEAAPGTIAQSYEWHQMYDYITKFGTNRIVAGDYKAFDKKMSPVFIQEAFNIMRAICEKSGNYSKDDLKCIDGIAKDTAFPLVDFNGDLVQFYGSNPSGHPLTVIVNSIVNSLYMRYVYALLHPEGKVHDFKQNVSLMTYGDDNIMSVNYHAPWYNHTSIAAAFQSFGITYTMADKEAESIPYIDIQDASFLKRSWSYSPEVGAMLAPLEHDSIEKMLMVWTKSKTICSDEQCMAVISSAMREYFFYGRKVYEEKQKLLKELVDSLNLHPWVQETTFPTFSRLIEEFWKNSQRVGCLPSDLSKIDHIAQLLNNQ